MRKLDTKERILKAAMTVFAQKGFAEASMNDVVRASGLSKGGVYWHYKSKNEMVVSIFEQFFDVQLKQSNAVLAQKASAGARLLELTRMTGQAVETWFTQFPHPLEFYAVALRDTTLKTLLQDYFRADEEQLSALVAEGVANGEFRDVDSVETARTLTGIFEGMLLLWAIKPDRFDLSRQVEAAVNLLLKGLQNPGRGGTT